MYNNFISFISFYITKKLDLETKIHHIVSVFMCASSGLTLPTGATIGAIKLLYVWITRRIRLYDVIFSLSINILINLLKNTTIDG